MVARVVGGSKQTTGVCVCVKLAMACGGGGDGYFKLMYNSITACNPTGAKTLSVRVCDRNGFDSSGLNSCNDCAAIVKGEKHAE